MIPNKYTRYRQKQIKAGRCPHCGKPCAPFYECDERRMNKQVSKSLNKLIQIGLVIRTDGLYRANPIKPILSKRAMGYRTKEGDRRRWPRIGKKYLDIKEIMVIILREGGKPLDMGEIESRMVQKITEIKREVKDKV